MKSPTAFRARFTRPHTAAAPAKWRARPRRRLAAALLAFCLLTPAVIAPGAAEASTTLPVRTALERTMGGVIEILINAERAAHGIRRVYMSPRLRLSARRHNITMARYDTMSHQLPGEAYFADRISRTGYHWTWAGENIAWNSSMTIGGVALLEKLMYNEHSPNDGHRLNILNPNFRNVGMDVYMDWAHHKVWLTTDFGRQ